MLFYLERGIVYMVKMFLRKVSLYMSETFHIISDGSCDLPTELIKEKHLLVVPFYVSFDDRNYKKEIVEMTVAFPKEGEEEENNNNGEEEDNKE